MIVLRFVGLVVFGLFAYWQTNDPDWKLWLVIYALAALSGFYSKLPSGKNMLIVFLAFTVGFAANVFPNIQSACICDECFREFIGLGLIALFVGAIARVDLRAPSSIQAV